jgi:hypothetical protein
MISSARLTTDRFAGHDTSQGHERRATGAYLWLGLPLMFLVRLALPVTGYGGVLLVGLAHLGLLAAVVRRRQRQSCPRDAALRLASLLLVLGPAVFFFGAITGSPNPVDSLGYGWNTIGVATGSLVTTAGLVALATSLCSRGNELPRRLPVSGSFWPRRSGFRRWGSGLRSWPLAPVRLGRISNASTRTSGAATRR